MNPNFYALQIRTRLNTTDPRASTSARLRALMPYIETRLAEGVPHSAIVEDLRGRATCSHQNISRRLVPLSQALTSTNQ